MKVICDNCRAVYRIPDAKLIKPVNKATCRKCGHRMLIPRPRKDAPTDEQTLVTAVPPNVAAATGRSASARPTTPIEDESETTVPGVANEQRSAAMGHNVQLFPGTPSPARGRHEPPTVVSQQHREVPATPHPAAGRGQLAPAPHTTPAPMASRTPAPAPIDMSRPTAPTAAPYPAYPAAGSAPHDPAGDMMWAVLGICGAIAGSLILSVDDHPVVLFAGLLLALGGCFTALLVVMTGARGRKPARPLLSLVSGTMLATMCSAAVAVGLWVLGEYLEPGEQVAATAAAPPPATAPATPVAPATTAPATAAATPDDPPPSAPAPSTSSRATTSASSASSRSSSSSPPPAPTTSATPPPAPTPSTTRRAPPPPPPAAPAAPTQVPFTVIDTILRNNIEVKKCFFNHLQAEGSLPSRVDVQFLVQPNGSVQGAKVTQVAYAGTSLDSCLGRTINALQLPATSGPPQKINYPFNLN